ncbi:MAG: hypothetical protein APF81_26505 [Desulfosporosinus sp. BRH_c37]|nr:MAG: hypothetical protein APF81_26505 [Desulfosporosinus sp. BRH_c37]
MADFDLFAGMDSKPTKFRVFRNCLTYLVFPDHPPRMFWQQRVKRLEAEIGELIVKAQHFGI